MRNVRHEVVQASTHISKGILGGQAVSPRVGEEGVCSQGRDAEAETETLLWFGYEVSPRVPVFMQDIQR